jgi:formate-dependent nitrite reductase membrane component NrfD
MPYTDIDTVAANAATAAELHVWGWEIALYLFLGGLVAGLLVLSGFAHRRAESPPPAAAFWGPLLAPLLLGAGMFALFLDLENKLHVWRFYTTFQWKSPMSWGSWILVLVFPAAALFAWAAWSEFRPGRERGEFFGRRAIARLNIVLGAALGVYTGILLGALGARPLWNTPLLGPLFLVSGMSGAAALLMLIEKSEAARANLARLDAKLLGVEASIFALIFLGLATGGEAQRAAAHLFFGGPYTAVFWVGVVFLGMIAPIALERLAHSGRAQATAWPQVLILLGGITLRAVIVLAGQASRWEVL